MENFTASRHEPISDAVTEDASNLNDNDGAKITYENKDETAKLQTKESATNAERNETKNDDETQKENKKEITTNDNEVVIRHYKGVVIGAKNMDDIENMDIRDDDLFVVTFPRSGTTLVQEMSFLISTGDFESANNVILDDRFPYLDFDLRGPLYPFYRGVQFIKEKPSPRFIKSHFHHFLLPRQLCEGKGKIIYVARNPRDALVSYYKLQRWFKFETRTFVQFYEDFMSGVDILCGPYWSHVKGFWELRHNPNILFLKFEDIIKDMVAAAKQISSFLGKSPTDSELARIVEHCQIHNMKKNPATNWSFKEKLQEKNTEFGSFINTGKTGDVEGFYTDEMLKRLQKKFAQEFSNTGLTFPSFP